MSYNYNLCFKKVVFIFTLASCVMYISYLVHQNRGGLKHYVYTKMFLTQKVQVTLEEQQEENIGNPLVVLFWTGNKVKAWSTHWGWAKKEGDSCRVMTPSNQTLVCNFTMDKNVINDTDALIYMGTDRDRAPLPPRPKDKVGGQVRMMFMREAPEWLVASSIKTFPSGFNWTFTYRSDSDISASYGVVVPLDIDSTATTFATTWTDNNLTNHELEIPNEKLEQYIKNYICGKTKLIAWTVSHCGTRSKREKIVKQLQKFIPVDIYGKCGPFKCTATREKNWATCYPELGAKYKFYLSFENALCEDYVTEKFYFALENGMIPIVYGGANYHKFAPPGSFINILDYSSLKDLATYIQFLDKNPMEYLKYFLWKEKYRIAHPQSWCDMCTALWRHTIVDPTTHRNIIDPNYSKIYPDMTQWFFNSHQDENSVTDDENRNETKLKKACQSPSKFI